MEVARLEQSHSSGLRESEDKYAVAMGEVYALSSELETMEEEAIGRSAVMAQLRQAHEEEVERLHAQQARAAPTSIE